MNTVNTPRWQQLLDQPENLDATGISTAIIADGGDTAYRRSLAKWNSLRDGSERDALAGIALVLADAFDDHRAVDEIAATWPEVFPEQFAWRTALAEPGKHVRRAFGQKALSTLRAWAETGTAEHLPVAATQTLRLLAPDDAEETYLPLRRLLLERAHEQVVKNGTSAAAEPDEDASTALIDTAERAADDLLVAAARATPDSHDVQRTVLSYWGEAEPLDAVPTAHPRPGEPPASWTATCALIAGAKSTRVLEQLINLVRNEESLEHPELEQYVAALGRSHAHDADARLLELAKSDSSIAGTAVRTLAARRRRLAKAEPPMMARLDALVTSLREHRILLEAPGVQARAALAQQRTDDEAPMHAALAIADAYGRPTGGELTLEWASFATWLDAAELPAPAPAPAAPRAKRGRGDGLFGGLFQRR